MNDNNAPDPDDSLSSSKGKDELMEEEEPVVDLAASEKQQVDPIHAMLMGDM